jgi:hypothetical protein
MTQFRASRRRTAPHHLGFRALPTPSRGARAFPRSRTRNVGARAAPNPRLPLPLAVPAALRCLFPPQLPPVCRSEGLRPAHPLIKPKVGRLRLRLPPLCAPPPSPWPPSRWKPPPACFPVGSTIRAPALGPTSAGTDAFCPGRTAHSPEQPLPRSQPPGAAVLACRCRSHLSSGPNRIRVTTWTSPAVSPAKTGDELPEFHRTAGGRTPRTQLCLPRSFQGLECKAGTYS